MGVTDYLNQFIVNHILLILTGIYLITVVPTAIMVIHEKRDPHKTSTWVLILLLLPIVGLIFYIYFGQNFRKQKIFNRKGLKDLQEIERISRSQLVRFKKHNQEKTHNPSISNNLPIIRLLLNNSKAILTERNKVGIIQEGRRAFDAMIEAIDNAKSSIHLEFYIVSNDTIGNHLKNLLIKKSTEGVEVKLIFDDVGSWSLPKKFILELKMAGVEIMPFMAVKFPLLTSKINNRNHRKIVVVDGVIGFMGGMNVADRYIEGNETLGPWYDTMLKIEGEAVHVLQIIFLTDWYFVSGKVVLFTNKFFNLKEWRTKEKKIPKTSNPKSFFPEHSVSEQHVLQITTSGPDSDWSSIMQAFFAAIARANRHIYISSPYFVPNESILTALKTASLSGIDVRIVLPGKSDSTVVFWSSMSYVGELIEAGIKIYLNQKGFNHSKLLMIDGNISSVGSANMDIRSFEDNFEILAMVYDSELTAELERNFLKDLKFCQLITPENWANRPFINNIKESIARLFSPLF